MTALGHNAETSSEWLEGEARQGTEAETADRIGHENKLCIEWTVAKYLAESMWFTKTP